MGLRKLFQAQYWEGQTQRVLTLPQLQGFSSKGLEKIRYPFSEAAGFNFYRVAFGLPSMLYGKLFGLLGMSSLSASTWK